MTERCPPGCNHGCGSIPTEPTETFSYSEQPKSRKHRSEQETVTDIVLHTPRLTAILTKRWRALARTEPHKKGTVWIWQERKDGPCTRRKNGDRVFLGRLKCSRRVSRWVLVRSCAKSRPGGFTDFGSWGRGTEVGLCSIATQLRYGCAAFQHRLSPCKPVYGMGAFL